MPNTKDAPALLRRAILIDALATGAMGALLLFAASMLEGLLGLPQGLLRWVSLVLLPFAAVLAYVALRPQISARVTWALIGCNVLWVVDSLLLLVSGWLEPTMLGVAFVLAQGAVVAAFAYFEYAGLRRGRTLQVD